MHTYLETTIELLIGFFALLILTKIIGRSSIAEATPFDFVSTLVLGEFVGNALFSDDVDPWKMLYSIFFWGILILVIDFITLKINKSRGIFESEPSIVINNGIIDRATLKKTKVDMNRLQAMLREKNVFSIREIEHAIIEPNGKLSIIKKPIYDTVSKGDLNVPIKSVSLPITLVSDGVLIKQNFPLIGRDVEWLKAEIKKRNIHDIRNVMFAEWREEDGLFVQTIYKSPTD
ncbi:uncharacterized membrane protein YcaP (DUF421 family) [Pullulanibacillus pueri]|uniref:DUF421 domain-containing protein n=1 Tax=Pullulanibacillus pueri TaxID=1437324 RepID=A0A8J3EML0_9BACL|nr:DUF421 domain-containing protein [Pullulanibacillus pueri]MBM7680613.1 uncharacterized membrane protein YcaP (DUF421 family) [Pullulanibacillus pueri]GGH83938.1 DUF421 domain-containing protein [Pullulanibacillus pueri]